MEVRGRNEGGTREERGRNEGGTREERIRGRKEVERRYMEGEDGNTEGGEEDKWQKEAGGSWRRLHVCLKEAQRASDSPQNPRRSFSSGISGRHGHVGIVGSEHRSISSGSEYFFQNFRETQARGYRRK